MTKTREPTSTAAINAEQREIARDMDDIKQEEEAREDDPKQQQIAGEIDRAEQRRKAGTGSGFGVRSSE